MLNTYFVYILCNKRNGTLYVGMTSDLENRVFEHKMGLKDGFSKKYNTKKLVYFERHDDPESAILREKTVKKWRRAWKINLIEKNNPQWKDLSKDWYDAGELSQI